MDLFNKGGRYHENVKDLIEINSEERYYKNIFDLEILYYIELIEHGAYKGLLDMGDESIYNLSKMIKESIKFNLEAIKTIEKSVNHDIGAVKTFLTSEIKHLISSNIISKDTKKIDMLSQLVHFGLTSQDLVNTVRTKMFIESFYSIKTDYDIMLTSLKNFFDSENYMLTFSHGQVAVPSTIKRLGKTYENRLSILNLEVDLRTFTEVKFGNGATGSGYSMDLISKLFGFYENEKLLGGLINNDAHKTICFKTVNKFLPNNSNIMVEGYTFQNNCYTTIVDSFYEYHKLTCKLLDFVQDMWIYASKGYIIKQYDGKEIGSSTMPQKINPIEFENAEGNLKIFKGQCEIYMDNLNITRMHRDLSDVTIVRGIGNSLCYFKQAIKSINKALSNYRLNHDIIQEDLRNNLQCNSEFIQLLSILEGNSDCYKVIKEMSRHNQNWTKEDLIEVVRGFKNIDGITIIEHLKI